MSSGTTVSAASASKEATWAAFAPRGDLPGGEAPVADDGEVPAAGTVGEGGLELGDAGEPGEALAALQGKDKVGGDVAEERGALVAAGLRGGGHLVD